jgi:hypothetical protein
MKIKGSYPVSAPCTHFNLVCPILFPQEKKREEERKVETLH